MYVSPSVGIIVILLILFITILEEDSIKQGDVPDAIRVTVSALVTVSGPPDA